MDGARTDDAMLRDVLADIRADIREVARENREAQVLLREAIEAVARDSRENNRLVHSEMELLHAQVIEMRTRWRMASGIAGLFGGTLVVAVTKGITALFAKG